MKTYKQYFLLISFLLSISTHIFSQELIPFRKGDLWGYANKEGKIQINCKYDKVSSFKDGFAYVYKSGNKSIINNKGKEILPFNNWVSFSKVKHQDTFVVVNKMLEGGVINKDGDIIIPFGKYEKMEFFNEYGVAKVQNANLFGVVNFQGKEILPLDVYQYIYLDQKTDYLYLKKNDKYILLSPQGELISNKKYDNIYGLKDTTNYFITLNDGLLGVIDAKGEECLPNLYEDIDYGNEDVFRVKKNNLWAYVTNQNKIISQEEYDKLEPFNNHFAKVIKKGKYGVINKNGKLIIDFSRYDDIKPLQDGVFIVKKEGKSGVVNQDGKEIVAPNKYQKITDFKGDFAIVSIDGKYGMINSLGKEIKACKFDEIKKVVDKAFQSTLFVKDTMYIASKKVFAKYKQQNKYGLMNAQGKVLLKAEYSKIDITYAHHNLLVTKQDVKSKKKSFGYYNTNKEIFTTDIIYKSAKRFENKLFFVAEVQLQNNKRTAINSAGKNVISPELHFQKIKQISNNLLLIKSNNYSLSLYNILQKKHNIPLGKYSIITASKDNQFFVVGTKVKEVGRISTKYGINNANGKEITEVKYDKIEGEFNGDFVKNNIIEVKLDGKKGYIDTNGKEFFK